METTISSKSDSIQVVYDSYVKDLYVVNRKYQRKLVWTCEEKIAFIDSIYKKYSVPLFLVANINDKSGIKYEIIDGLQRLNAISSFIENEFPIKYNNQDCFFDLQTLASTKDLQDNGKLKQKEPILPRAICIEMVSYQLPFSYITADTLNIEEIFRRINSFGRQLSNQEIRQAGAIGAFSDLVRILSSEIRGDVTSSDKILLNDMNKISLSSKDLEYGINLNNIFWVKQGIITIRNMRISRDEELIAWLLSYMILGSSAQPTSKLLDKLYSYSDKKSEKVIEDIEENINKYGKDKIKNWFLDVFSNLSMILKKEQGTFRDVIYTDNNGEGLVRTFQIIYLSFFELIIKKSMVINDQSGLARVLQGIGNRHLKNISGKEWNAQFRNEKIQSVVSVLQPYFKQKVGEDVARENWEFQLDNILRLSKVEGGQYDYKIGFHNLDDKTEINTEMVKKAVKILTAEVNKHSNTNGYVIIGIADGKASYERFKNYYNLQEEIAPVNNSDFYVTGIDEEIKKFYKNSDEYLRKVKNIIKSCPIEEDAKFFITSNMKMVTYNEKSILVLHLMSKNKPYYYNDCLFIREGNDTEEIKKAAVIATFLNNFDK